MKIRAAFLVAHGLQHLGLNSHRIRESIRAAKKATRHGDAVTDAKLYDAGHRRDIPVYQCVYGLQPEEVLQLGKMSPTLFFSIYCS
jgi:hypothetical protein